MRENSPNAGVTLLDGTAEVDLHGYASHGTLSSTHGMRWQEPLLKAKREAEFPAVLVQKGLSAHLNMLETPWVRALSKIRHV